MQKNLQDAWLPWIQRQHFYFRDHCFNGRKKTERKAGGQKGHSGTTLTRSDIEEKIASGRCRHEVRTLGRASGQDYVTKYVIDLNVEPVNTEIRIYADENGAFHIPEQYRSDVTYGENVKALAVSLYSEGVMSNDRIAAFLNAAGNGELDLSEGSVYGFCRKFAGISATSIRHPEEKLPARDVAATDAATVTVNGEQNYIRNFSAGDTVVYHAMNSKSIEALKKLDFLKQGKGENKGTAHKYAKKEEAALLGRMEKYSHNHLLFLQIYQ